jgi:branched-chain amino acid transport system permease protein
LILQIIFNSLTLGAIYALIASGFTLVYGVTRIINFAHGELYMAGGMTMYIVYAVLGIPFPIALAISALTSAVLGITIERFIIRRVRGGEALRVLVLTIGAQLVIMTAVLAIFGPRDKTVPSAINGLLRVGTVIMPWERIIALVSSVAIISGLFLFIKFTKRGQAMRAIALDPEAAALQGIKVNPMYTLSMGIGSILAGASGALMAPILPVNPFTGPHATIYAILVVCVAGLGNIPGAVVGGMILGFVENFAYSLLGGFSEVISFGFVLVLLVFKPEGLFSKKWT